MRGWLIRLSGDTTDLADLSRQVPQRIVEENGDHHLVSPDVELLQDPCEVLAKAEAFLKSLTGLFRVRFRRRLNVRVAGIAKCEGNQPATQFIMGASGIPSSEAFGLGGMVRIAGDCSPAAPPLAGDISVLKRHPNISKALSFFGAAKTTWTSLYRAFDAIEGEVGSGITKQRWTTESEMERFTQTASHYRHGKQKYKLPSKPMSLAEGESFVRNLFEHLLRSRSGGPRPTEQQHHP